MTGSARELARRFAVVRVALLGTALALASTGADAMDNVFQRSDLTDGASKLEAQIKQEAGVAARRVAVLKGEADMNIEHHDFRAGIQTLTNSSARCCSGRGYRDGCSIRGCGLVCR